jgi:hypothetical protein
VSKLISMKVQEEESVKVKKCKVEKCQVGESSQNAQFCAATF